MNDDGSTGLEPPYPTVWTSHTFSLDEARAQEQEVLLHIARITVRGARIDNTLTLLLANAISTTDSVTVYDQFSGELHHVLITHLEKSPIGPWWKGSPLRSAVKTTQTYRNELAHSMVDTTFSMSTASGWQMNTHTRRAKAPEPVEADPRRMRETEARAFVVHAVLGPLAAMTRDEVLASNVREVALSELPDSRYATAQPEIIVARDELFPNLGAV